MQTYSLSSSIAVPSSVLAQFSLPSSYHPPCYDDEPDYPANYEASPDSTAATAASSVLATGEYSDVFSHSLLAHAPHPACEATNEKEPYQPNDSKTCMISSSELVEQQHKHLHDDASIIEINAKARADEQYRAMKLKYLRSVAIQPSAAAAAAHRSSVCAATPSYVAESSLVSASQRFEMMEKRRHDEASDDILPSIVEVSTPANTAPKPGQGLLSRLLSGRVPTAPSSPKTPSSPVSGVSPVLFPSASVSSLSALPSTPAVAVAPSSSSVAPSFVRRTSPISIPKRMQSSGDDDGVRYRKARMPTREELEEEERDRVRSIAIANNNSGVSSRRSSAACRQSEFSFADVFAAPSMPSTSSRPIAIASKKSSSSRMTVIPVCHTPSPAVSHALPSSMLDGFLAL